MKEYFQHIGKVGVVGLTMAASNACTPESEYIKGTVVGIRQEKEETRIEERIMSLSDCPKGTTHLSVACTPKPYEVTVYVRDVPDHVLMLESPTGAIFNVYVWPRVERQARIGEPIKIDPRYGSLKDQNNEETILSKSPIE